MKLRMGRDKLYKEELPDFTSIASLFRTWDERFNSPVLPISLEDQNQDSILPQFVNKNSPAVRGDGHTLQIYRPVGPNVVSRHPQRNGPSMHSAPPALPHLYVSNDFTGADTTPAQLAANVSAFRHRVWESLSHEVRKALDRRERVHIAILAPEEHEFTVAMQAALELGATVVPMSAAWPREEALNVLFRSGAAAILVSSGALRAGLALEKSMKDADAHSPLVCIPVPALPHNRSLRQKKPKAKL